MRGQRRNPTAVVVAGLVASPAASVAQADTTTVERALSVESPGECLDAGALARQVVVWLGRSDVDARIRIAVRRSGSDGATVAFEVREGSQILAERAFERLPRDCSERRAALGLAIAFAID